MNIGIIGAGHVGGALALATVRAGHRVKVSAKHPENAEATAARTGAIGARNNREAVAGADLVILAVPVSALAVVASEIADLVRDVTVVDVSNPVKQDLSGLLSQRSAAQDLQDRLPTAHVVKAFNTVFAAHQANPVVGGEPLDGFFAGDDPSAKARVAALLRQIGYRPIDVGPLSMSHALEDMELLNIRLNAKNDWPWQTEWKLVGPTA